MKRTHRPRIAQSWLLLSLLGAAAGSTLTSPAPARAWELGAHAGVGLDAGSVHLGGDALFPLAQLSPTARLSLWPSVAFVIKPGDDDDGLLLGADFPFEFQIANSVVKPFLGPGLGVAIFGETTVKLNVIGGLFIDTGRVRPFAELAVRFIRGTYVDLLAGLLVEI